MGARSAVGIPRDPGNLNISTVSSASVFGPPSSPHHLLKGRLRTPRSTQVLSTRSLELHGLNFASEVGLSQHTAVIAAV